MLKKTLISFLLAGAFVSAHANDNVLTYASKLMEVDAQQAASYLKQNQAKFKSAKDKVALGDWNYTYGQKSDALKAYEDALRQDPNNLDAVVSKYMILDLKNPAGRENSYRELLKYSQQAQTQANVRYFNYVGMLALEFTDLDKAYEEFDSAIKNSDQPESALGMGLVLEKKNPKLALEYYQSIVDNNMVGDDDKATLIARIRYLKGQ